SVDLAPAGLVRSWGVRADKARLLVELRRPLRPGAGEPPTLTARLRPTKPVAIDNQTLPFPDPVPLGARFREGALAIDLADRPPTPPLRTTAVAGKPGDGPRGKQPPTFYFPYRGEALSGTIRPVPRAPRVRATVRQDVFLGAGRAALETRLTLEAMTGRPASVILFQRGPGVRDWRVEGGPEVNNVRPAERLHRVELAAAPSGSFWRLTFDKPLRIDQPLTLRATRALAALPGTPARWPVPLVQVPEATRFEGEVAIHPAGSDLVRVKAGGLRETRSPPRGAPPAWRRYRYTKTHLFGGLHLELSTRGTQTAGVRLDRAVLTSVLGPGPRLRHHFRFRLSGWSQRTFPVKLPAGVRLELAAVAGSWLENVASGGDEPIELPGLAGRPCVCELVWSTRASSRPWTRLQAPLPELPVVPSAVRRRWLLPPGVLPASSGQVRRLPGGASGAGLLPRSLNE